MVFKNRLRQQRFQINWYHERRRRVVSRLGGKCVKCGTTEGELCAVAKDLGGKRGKLNYSVAWKTLVAQLENRELLCKPCASRKLGELNKRLFTKHGITRWKEHKCRCAVCRAAMTRQMQAKKEMRQKNVEAILKKRIAESAPGSDKGPVHS